MTSLKGAELVKYLQETYGNIISITNIQLQNGKYDITAETENKGTVYFSNGNGFDDYRYAPQSDDWHDHVLGGLELDLFSDEPVKRPSLHFRYTDHSPAVERWIKHLNKKYGKIKSINITYVWKYVVSAKIIVENRDSPVTACLSNCYDDYLNVNTYDLTWEGIFNGESVDVHESDSE